MISIRAVLLNRLNTFTWHFFKLFSLLTLLAHPPYCQTHGKLNETTKIVESSHPSQPSHNFPHSKANSIIQSTTYNPFFALNSSPSQSVFLRARFREPQMIFNPVRRCRGRKPTMITSNYFCEIVAAQTSIMSFTTGTHLDSSYSEVRSFLAGFVPFLAPDLPGEIIK